MINGRKHKYGFGGKEYQDELGLDWYDVSARNYDPALGRWMNTDPLAEMMRSQSTYNYAFNNPISLVDEDGNAPKKPDDIITTVHKVMSNTKNKIERSISVHITLTVVNLSGADLSDTMFKGGSGSLNLSNFEGKSFFYASGAKMIQDNIESFTVDYNVVDSVGDIGEKDNVLLVVDNIPNTDKETNPAGLAGNGVSAVEAGTIKNGTFNEVAQHELAHDAGADHRKSGGLMGESVNGSTNVHQLTKGEIIWNQIDTKSTTGTTKDSDSNVRYNNGTNVENVNKFIKDNDIK